MSTPPETTPPSEPPSQQKIPDPPPYQPDQDMITYLGEGPAFGWAGGAQV